MLSIEAEKIHALTLVDLPQDGRYTSDNFIRQESTLIKRGGGTGPMKPGNRRMRRPCRGANSCKTA